MNLFKAIMGKSEVKNPVVHPTPVVNNVKAPVTAIKKDMSQFQFDGFTEERTDAKFVNILPDEFLKELNAILDWNCFTVDKKGRRFGQPTGPTKREKPQAIPDRRVLELQQRFDLKNMTVLEVGCFEGVHTIGLCQHAKKVKAIDSRIENVVKTIVRTSFYDCHPQVFRVDLEAVTPQEEALLQADILHHVGVLYHLSNPVAHLKQVASYISTGIMLDTHFATPEMVNSEYTVDGKTYKYYRHKESGYSDVFSGMKDHAKWLLLEDLQETLRAAGFGKIEIFEKRDERNGPRVLLFAGK